jgi:hypothetical protein
MARLAEKVTLGAYHGANVQERTIVSLVFGNALDTTLLHTESTSQAHQFAIQSGFRLKGFATDSTVIDDW